MPALPLIPISKKWSVLATGAALYAVLYFSCEWLGQKEAVQIQALSFIDKQIPLVNWTIGFYFSQYLLIPITFMLIKKPENYSPMFYSMFIAALISCSIFLVYPTTA